jgi:uncharacterized protein YecE (DUF72 family)
MAPRRRGEYRIGTSGYQYDHWRGSFYPEDLPKKDWLPFYARHFDTVELNNSFYHLPSAEAFDHWRREAPEGFCFVLKFSRYGSHLKKLTDPENSIGNFLENASHLGPMLGPILVQLPPHWHADPDRLAGFLEAAPESQRWAFEFRDETWLADPIFDVLRKHNAALCIHDLIENHPRVVTADWVYLRFHGARDGGSYSHQHLAARADEIAGHLEEGLDVFAYFNNDAEGYALDNARDLRRYVEAREPPRLAQATVISLSR